MKYAGTDVLNLMTKAKNYNNYLVNSCLSKINKNSKTIIDFGAGLGTFSELLAQRGFSVECIEPDAEQAEIIKKKGLTLIESIDNYPDNSIDNIVSFNVFEHIKDDEIVLEQIQKKLKPDGIFFLFVPANSKLYSSFDKKLGHFRRYDLDNLLEMVRKCNFAIKNYEYFDSLGYILAFIYKIINHCGTISAFSILLFDKIIFPISILSDKVFNKKFGKNIVMILSKEAINE